MKSLIGQSLYMCMLVTTVVSPASAEGAEPQLVADEFREALARISVATSAKPPEAVDFPPQVARFVRVLIHETSGRRATGVSTNWRYSAPKEQRTSRWSNAVPSPARCPFSPVTRFTRLST